MRVSPARRRRWNNILILCIIGFIALINLPSLIKSYLLEPPATPYPAVLINDATLTALHFNYGVLELRDGEWEANFTVKDSAPQLAQRWQTLVGTPVDEETFEQLEPNLKGPQSIEAWYRDREEPQRITIYRSPQFWLMKNDQQRWVAVTAERTDLFPPIPKQQ
ncbi:hypothetical protein M1D72_21090 [Vibrio sp. AK197]